MMYCVLHELNVNGSIIESFETGCDRVRVRRGRERQRDRASFRLTVFYSSFEKMSFPHSSLSNNNKIQ